MLTDSDSQPVTTDHARENFLNHMAEVSKHSAEALNSLCWLMFVELKKLQRDCSFENRELARRFDGSAASFVFSEATHRCIEEYLQFNQYSLGVVEQINRSLAILSRAYGRDDQDEADRYLPDVSLSLHLGGKHYMLVHVRDSNA